MLNVFLTVDTESSFPGIDRAGEDLEKVFQRDINGIAGDGEYGLRFLLNEFGQNNLDAVFFVEPLFSYAAGMKALRDTVSLIRGGGHDIGLHLHPEWLARADGAVFGGIVAGYMKDLSREQQARLLKLGLSRLSESGAPGVSVFRAGDFGANTDTLLALEDNNMIYDSSYNACYLNAPCDITTTEMLLQPRRINGIYEFPISFFRDRPGHFRHLQLMACSSGELEHALLQAWQRGWFAVVVLLHSFEVIVRKVKTGRRPCVDPIVRARFRKFCKFLAVNRDKFRTMTFSKLDPEAIPDIRTVRPLRSNILRTGARYAQQAIRRVYSSF